MRKFAPLKISRYTVLTMQWWNQCQLHDHLLVFTSHMNMGFTVLWCIRRVKHLRTRKRKDNCLVHFPMTRVGLQSRSTLCTYVVVFTLIYCYIRLWQSLTVYIMAMVVLCLVSTGGWTYSIQLCPLQISFKSRKPWIHLCVPSASAWPSLGILAVLLNALYSLYLLCTTVWPHSVYFAYQVSHAIIILNLSRLTSAWVRGFF